MSKRAVNILVVVVIIGLIAGIIGYFVSPAFQAWTQIWLGRPDGLAATAKTVAALATLFAVIVGLRGISIGRELAQDAQRQAQEALEEGRNQFLAAQYNDNRPLLVPSAGDSNEQNYGEPEPIVFDWNADIMFVNIQNVGTGIATNIWLTLLPPAPAPESSYQYVSQLRLPVVSDSDPLKIYLQHGISLFNENDRLNEYSLFVPQERAAGSTARADRFIARLSITYHDIFGRKHASIFDIN